MSRDEDAAGWEAYWRRFLADSGIEGLEPLPNTEFVELTQLTQPAHLRAICTAEFLSTGADLEIDEHLSPLCGGLAFLAQGVPQLVPQCCGDLEGWREWRAVAADPPDDWLTIWIGHPQVSVRRRGTGLELSQLHDDDAEPRAVLTLNLERLRTALSAVEVDLNAFAQRLERALPTSLDAARARHVARILSGLRE